MKTVGEVREELTKIIEICESLAEADGQYSKDYNALKDQAQRYLDTEEHPLDFKVGVAGFERGFETFVNKAYEKILREKRIFLIKAADVSGNGKLSKSLNTLAEEVKVFLDNNEYSLESNCDFEELLWLVNLKIKEARLEHEELN